MKLLTARIIDFKSIKDLTIHFKNNSTCLIGKNESGKSSIIEALQYFNYYKLFDNNFKLKNKKSPKYNKELPHIKGTFKININEIPKENISEFLELFTVSTQKIWNSYYAIKDLDLFYTFFRWGDGVENLEIEIYSADNTLDKINLLSVLTSEKQKNKAIELFSELFMPVIELYTDEELKIKPATVEDLKGESAEFETLRRLLKLCGCDDFSVFDSEDDYHIGEILGKVKDEFTALFSKHYNQDKSIKFELSFLRNKIILQIYDSTDARYSIDERSPGFKYFFAFLINKSFLTKDSKKPIIFLLDEPGANLYPHGCKSLLKTFEEFSLTNQLIYTTHNIFLTLRDDIDSLIFTKKDSEKGTSIEKQSYKNKYQIFRKELGILLNDSFLIGNINIIVEGDTEHFVLRQLVSELASKNEEFSSLEWLNIYDAGGVSEVQNALRYLNSLGDELCGIVLLDSDPAGDKIFNKEAFRKLIDNKRWFCIRINEVFGDNKIRTFEDLFPQANYIKAYNQHYKTGFYDFDNKFTNLNHELELPTPIVDSIEESHYIPLFKTENQKKQAISKINIMRALLEDTKTIESKERDFVLANSIKLIQKINTIIKQIKNG